MFSLKQKQEQNRINVPERFLFFKVHLFLGKAIQESPLINDPISAVVVGMLATVVLQSATTTTNILVTMVAANSERENEA